MPAVRKIKIPLADLFWLPFFSKGIQSTLGQIRKSVTERNALLSYCECVCFNWGSPIQESLIKGSYRPPQTWKEFFGDGEDTEVWATNRGDLRKPPHGTPSGFALHFDDCPALVSKLLMQIARFDYGKAESLKDRLLLWHNYDPGAGIRFNLWHEDLLAKRRAKTLRQPLVPKRTLKEIKRLHPENWPGIVASIENRTAISRAKLKPRNHEFSLEKNCKQPKGIMLNGMKSQR